MKNILLLLLGSVLVIIGFATLDYFPYNLIAVIPGGLLVPYNLYCIFKKIT